jgi:hypothetical protein
MKSGNLNFLEQSGPLQSCNRTALLFALYMYIKGAIFISLYKSQQNIETLKDYRLNAIATTANLHWLYKEHLTLKNITARYQQQIFQHVRQFCYYV